MMKNEKSGIGRRISELRRANHMTQEDLADVLDVSPKHISHVEREVKALSLQNLIKLSRLFGCSLDYLVLGKHKEDALDKLPKTIQYILHSNDNSEIERLIRYLSIYVEMYTLIDKKN